MTASIPPHIIGGKCAYPRAACSATNTTCTTDDECCSGHCGSLPGTPPDSGRSNTCLPKTVPSGSPAPMCDYAAPPEGCRYVPGPDYNPVTACGLELRCPDISPAPTSSGSPVPRTCAPRIGDVTCNGTVDIADLAFLSDILLGKLENALSDTAFRNADITQDGVLNIADLAALRTILVPAPAVQ